MKVLPLEALGVRLRVEVDDDDLGTLLAGVLADLDAPQQEDALLVRVAGRSPWRTASPGFTGTASTPPQALSQALAAVNLTAVAATPLLAFHAAVLSREDRTVVLPGRSGLGKSTLTARLLLAGWSYVSDEALSLDWSGGRPLPYPRPLALSPWSLAVAGQPPGAPADGETVVRARDLGAAVRRDPAPVTHVALLRRQDHATVEEIGRNDALRELLERGFTHHHDGGRALQVLADLLRTATVLRVGVGDPREAARLLTDAAWRRPRQVPRT